MRTWTGSCQPTTTHEEPHPPHGHMRTGIRPAFVPLGPPSGEGLWIASESGARRGQVRGRHLPEHRSRFPGSRQPAPCQRLEACQSPMAKSARCRSGCLGHWRFAPTTASSPRCRAPGCAGCWSPSRSNQVT